MISSGNLSPGFSPSTTSYTVRVDHNVTVCTISAKTADSKATYQVTGSKNLSVGSNVRKVIVTAESGKTKTYTIQILRADSDGKIEEPDKDKENDKDKEDDKKEAIKVSIGKTEYILVDDLTGIEIPEGFSMCIVTYEGKDLSGIENQDKDVTLCLLQNEDGEQEWYFFDKEKEAFTKTQRFTPAQIFSYVKENTVYTTNEDVSEKEQESGFLEKMDSTDFLLLCLGGTVGLLLIIVLIILIINLKRRK